MARYPLEMSNFQYINPDRAALFIWGGGGEGAGGRTFHAADELAMELDGLDGLMDGLEWIAVWIHELLGWIPGILVE